MFDPDTDTDIYREHSDVTCPACGHTEPVVPDVLGYYSRRYPHTIVWYFVCEKCAWDWDWEEDLRDD
jgi:hypothetical protein